MFGKVFLTIAVAVAAVLWAVWKQTENEAVAYGDDKTAKKYASRQFLPVLVLAMVAIWSIWS